MPARKKVRTSPRKGVSATFEVPECKRFTGYKPCFPDTRCYRECVDPAPIGTRILIVNLDAMGNVLVTTSLLHAIKRRWPVSRVYWITLKNAAPLLAHNPLLDRVYVWEPESWLILQNMQFDVVMNVDKSQRSAALTKTLRARIKRGYGLDDNGVIVPLNREAHHHYVLGLDDHLKFRVNTRSVSQLLHESMALPFARDPYSLRLTREELAFCGEARAGLGAGESEYVVGFNTGCSELYPNKKMTLDQHVTLIERMSELPGVRLILVGGPEDTERNAAIARRVGPRAISTPTTEGVRRGLCYINLCDIVVSGDSFGMHAAIALGKHVIVWFGVSCSSEIDLFDRGVKLVPEGLACSPCWKRECPYNLECVQLINLDAIFEEVRRVTRAPRMPSPAVD